MIRMTKRDVGRGCLLGALVGDAAGATLEFLGRKPDAAEVDRALEMVGGGPWRTAPGQITDDGELALCLARALAGPSCSRSRRSRCEYLDLASFAAVRHRERRPRPGLRAGSRRRPGRVHERHVAGRGSSRTWARRQTGR